MIPQLSKEYSLDPLYLSYFKAVAADASFTGDVEYSYAARLSEATDNSVYQLLPAGIIFPKTPGDIQTALRIAARAEFRKRFGLYAKSGSRRLPKRQGFP